MQQITTKQLSTLLTSYAKAQRALMVYGTYGIGKSEMTYQWSIKRAKLLNREFLDWIRSPEDKIQDAMKHPEKYYAFIDIRLSQLDPSDLRGIPNFATTEEYLQLVPFKWVVYITKPEAAGTVFFDEINLAPDLIMSSAYAIINDRHIADKKISDNIAIFGAGNLTTDTSLVRILPDPLKDRLGEVEMVFDVDYWFDAYANTHIAPHLLAFCQWKKTSIHSVSTATDKGKRKSTMDANNLKQATPRGIKRTSDLIKDLDISNPDNHNTIKILVASAVGEVFATEFMAYVKYYNEISWEDLIKDPETIVDTLSLDAKYVLIGGITERLTSLAEKESNMNTFFEKALQYLNILPYLSTEYIIPILNASQPIILGKNIVSEENQKKIYPHLIALLITGYCPLVTKTGLKEKYKEFFNTFRKKHNKVIATYTKILSQINAKD